METTIINIEAKKRHFQGIKKLEIERARLLTEKTRENIANPDKEWFSDMIQIWSIKNVLGMTNQETLLKILEWKLKFLKEKYPDDLMQILVTSGQINQKTLYPKLDMYSEEYITALKNDIDKLNTELSGTDDYFEKNEIEIKLFLKNDELKIIEMGPEKLKFKTKKESDQIIDDIIKDCKNKWIKLIENRKNLSKAKIDELRAKIKSKYYEDKLDLINALLEINKFEMLINESEAEIEDKKEYLRQYRLRKEIY